MAEEDTKPEEELISDEARDARFRELREFIETRVSSAMRGDIDRIMSRVLGSPRIPERIDPEPVEGEEDFILINAAVDEDGELVSTGQEEEYPNSGLLPIMPQPEMQVVDGYPNPLHYLWVSMGDEAANAALALMRKARECQGTRSGKEAIIRYRTEAMTWAALADGFYRRAYNMKQIVLKYHHDEKAGRLHIFDKEE